MQTHSPEIHSHHVIMAFFTLAATLGHSVVPGEAGMHLLDAESGLIVVCLAYFLQKHLLYRHHIINTRHSPASRQVQHIPRTDLCQNQKQKAQFRTSELQYELNIYIAKCITESQQTHLCDKRLGQVFVKKQREVLRCLRRVICVT